MSTNRNPLTTWLARIALAVAALIAVVVGVPVYLTATAASVHQDPEAAPAATQQASAQWSGAVDRARRVLRAALAEQNLPGLSVAVAAGGDIVWAEGMGWADVETRRPVTPETRFRIGPLSTMLTSAAVGVLLEKDRLRLDEEIQSYVPEYPKKQWPVTLGQLMAHRSGVGTEGEEDRPLSRQRCESPVDALRSFADDALLFEPGTQSRHSTYGWILVSAAVERAADQPFLTVMREQVFQPLGMSNTGAESAKEENPEAIGEPGEDPPPFRAIWDLILEPMGIGVRTARPEDSRIPATLYVRGFGPNPVLRHGLHVHYTRNLSCYAGARAFFSSPSDLVRFRLAIDNGTLLQPATAQVLEMSQPSTSGEEPPVSLISLPDRGIVVAVMSNNVDADTPTLAQRVADAFAQQGR